MLELLLASPTSRHKLIVDIDICRGSWHRQHLTHRIAAPLLVFHIGVFDRSDLMDFATELGSVLTFPGVAVQWRSEGPAVPETPGLLSPFVVIVFDVLACLCLDLECGLFVRPCGW